METENLGKCRKKFKVQQNWQVFHKSKKLGLQIGGLDTFLRTLSFCNWL